MKISDNGAVTASYASTTIERLLEARITADSDSPDAANASASEKTQYLASLRKATTELQSNVNAFLTSLMNEEAVKGAGSTVSQLEKFNEDKAEEMYGEESTEDQG